MDGLEIFEINFKIWAKKQPSMGGFDLHINFKIAKPQAKHS